MSEGILKALMQLFAIIGGKSGHVGESNVRLFLKGQLNAELTRYYIGVYNNFVDKFYNQSKLSDKKKSLASVKVLRICGEMNEELSYRDKLMVLLRLVEFVSQYDEADVQEWEFVQTVSESFYIEPRIHSAFLSISRLSGPQDALEWNDDHLCVLNQHDVHDLKGDLFFYWIEAEGFFLVKYLGDDEVLLNAQRLERNRSYAFVTGSAIRSTKIHPIYYSDVLQRFLKNSVEGEVVFQVNDLSYRFPNGRIALHPLRFEIGGGHLVGIMGGSGSGKSTLLNVLNGNLKPTQGSVTLNGFHVHHDIDCSRDLMGYVAQDDILFEELTVVENLFYSAKLDFPEESDEAVLERVQKVLRSVGLTEVSDLRVGSVLDKTISGGQRKRLNIALELVRESQVIFVDEPTSGLSSRDSEMIMDLLKELTLRGKLIFVVIHQPSSDIFKLFDDLLLLDQGGYPIYFGNPVESLIHFKKKAHFADTGESQCPQCGNVNPEQLFNIIEAKLVDEYGDITEIRKVTPQEWNEQFHQPHLESLKSTEKGARKSKKKGLVKAFQTFFKRDVNSKWVNHTYMLINLLEAPMLSVLLSLFVKFYPITGKGIEEYTFRENVNYPQYLFFAVVVALFLGLTVSAEEILKDKKILKRERYLGHSYTAYLMSKLGVMFLISLIQTASFLLVGNWILGVEGMFWPFLLVLFSVSCFANALGLNISATFDSAKVIYILIPIMIIPQLLFSGVIVRFDRLFPSITQQEKVPWIGEIMASRWAFEAMAVYQYTQNPYEQQFFEWDAQLKNSAWKKDFWAKEMQTLLTDCKTSIETNGKANLVDLELLYNELKREESLISDFTIPNWDGNQNSIGLQEIQVYKDALKSLESYYVRLYNEANQSKEAHLAALVKDEQSRDALLVLKNKFHNESIEDILTHKNDMQKIVKYDNKFVQKSNLVYKSPDEDGLFAAHFYAPNKSVFGYQLSTLWVNVAVLWAMTLLMLFSLQRELTTRLYAWIEGVRKK
jgi:ABC-type multidrug transport system ATPase subunit